MKKYLLISLALILIIGGIVYATVSPSRFPTGPGSAFPSMPTGQGTIGYILSLFPDGTAPNTEKLGGIPASGYLKNKVCAPLEVWMGIDADGYPICGIRTPYLVGNFTEGSMSVKRGTEPQRALALNDAIYEGDLIITSSSQTGTIQFDQDTSYLRLATDTTVELRRGTNTLGQTVAEAILADGQLWGRILTSTGVNLGGGGLVAGVRGTSVAIKKSGTAVTIAIIDSTAVGSNVATISNENTAITTDTINVSSGKLLTFTSGATTIPSAVAKTKTELLADTWNRNNTLSDISHLVAILPTSPVATTSRINAELSSTILSGNQLGTLLGNTTEGNEVDSDNAFDTSGTEIEKNTKKAKRIACKASGKTYWKTTDKCEEQKLYAFVDRTISTDIYYKNSTGSVDDTSHYTLPNNFPNSYGLSVISGKLNSGKTIQIFANSSNDEDALATISNTTTTNTLINQTGSYIYASGTSLKFNIFK